LLREHESPEIKTLGVWWTNIQTLSKSQQNDLVFPKNKPKNKPKKKTKKAFINKLKNQNQ